MTELSVPAATGGASSGGLGSALSSLTGGNTGSLVRAGLGLAALGGSRMAGSSSGNAPTDAGSIIDQMARANRVNINTPIGSRAWQQNPDGTWTVNDTMSAPEQANFENVQGLNAGVTNTTRDMLARILSQPQGRRAGSAFTVNGRTIGG